MGNDIKDYGDGLSLQVTRPARSAELVEENDEGEARYLAEVRVFAFDNLLVAFDTDRVKPMDMLEIVRAAARDTKSLYQAIDSKVHVAGNGYRVQLQPAADAGFREGDSTSCTTARNILLITKSDGTAAASNARRIAGDIKTIRSEQIS